MDLRILNSCEVRPPSDDVSGWGVQLSYRLSRYDHSRIEIAQIRRGSSSA